MSLKLTPEQLDEIRLREHEAPYGNVDMHIDQASADRANLLYHIDATETDHKRIQAQTLRDTAERYRAKAKELSETPGYGDRTLYHMVFGTLLDLADELDRDAAKLAPVDVPDEG